MTIELNTVENFTITKKGDSSIYIGLTRQAAVELLDKLKVALGNYSGMTIPRNSPEPDLPVGTRLLDDEGDTLVREAEGWRWLYLDGEYQPNATTYEWKWVTSEQSFVVIS